MTTAVLPPDAVESAFLEHDAVPGQVCGGTTLTPALIMSADSIAVLTAKERARVVKVR